MWESKNFTMFLLHVVVLWGLVFYLLWLCLHPKEPNYTIVDFHLSTHPNHGNTNTSRVNHGGHNSTFSFELQIENPNQEYGVYYNTTLLKFYYGQHTLGEKTIHSFYQKKGRTSQILIQHVNVPARTIFLKAISNANAELEVSLVTRIRYEMWDRTIKHDLISLHGHLPIGSDGKILGKKKIELHHSSEKYKMRIRG